MSAANFPFLQFFKVILPKTIQDKEMMLPRRFMKNFKDEFSGSDELKLEVADGRTWTVGLEAEEGYPNRVWLVSGFEDFLRFYSISLKQILLFRYLEPSRLKVFILRSTSMEITYPPLAPAPDSSELLERLKKMENMVQSNKFHLVFDTVSTNSKRAIERALEEMNPANISTLVVIASYHISPGFMRLPTKFTNKFCLGDSDEGTLQLSEEGADPDRVVRTWWVVFNKVVGMNLRQMSGWSQFRSANKIVEGDVCVFELIPPSDSDAKTVLKVRVFRTAD